MAFSFRAGTNWCHDFPKLARESGFCFNIHRTRVRVDWNRISSIDIERVIRERDFLTVDDNVNNVVDYSLESEYDVKILDPNFVKLFRLAQLSVEYLLYCKQYLDHSVIILKDELRLKIEDNAIIKKEIKALEDTIKDLNHKMKERNKIIESKLGDSNGELFKCPHCTKTFIAATFVSAHIVRRHGHLSDPYMPAASPVHEQYRAETEKLHNEIKTLKERLNQTERVIRNESEKSFDRRMDTSFRPDMYEKGEYTSDKEREERLKEQQIKYQDEIASLKNMLFTEIRNFKQKDRSMSPNYQVENDVNLMNLKELIKKQENEIHTLRDQLREQSTPDLKNVQEKIQIQEQHWKVINERLEKQHNLDTENLSTQLKMSQESAREMKELYESKVNELEMHSRNQTKMLEAQGMHLKQLSRDLWESREISQQNIKKPAADLQNKSSSRNINKKVQSIRDLQDSARTNTKNYEHEELVCEEIASLSSHESPKIFKSPKLNTKTLLQSEGRTGMFSGSGDFETSEDTESIRNNNNNDNNNSNIHVRPVINSRKLKPDKKLDIRNDKRNLVENLNLESLQSSRRKRILNENSQKYSNQENSINGFKTNIENRTQKSRKHRPNVNSPNLESYKPVSSTRSLNKGSRTLIRNMEPEPRLQIYKTKPDDKITSEKFTSKVNTRQKSMEEPEESEGYSESESETDTSGSESESVSENEDTEKMKPTLQRTGDFNSRDSFKELIHKNPDVLQELNVHLREVFDNKMRDLGIDPEWNGIPTATFKQKIQTIAHHRNINSKKINGYNHIREKILREISQTLLKKRATEPVNLEKISPLDKIMNKVKIKTANVLKQPKTFEPRTPILKSQLMMPREKSSRPTSSLEILPKKMRESDIHEIRSDKSTESLHKRDSEFQQRIRPISVQNTETLSHTKPGVFNRKQTSDIINRNKFVDDTVDSTSMEQLSQSQDEVEYFSESNSVSKTGKHTLQPKSTKVTSTPNKSFADITERSYSSVEEESDDNELIKHERARSLPVSPKNNKSVLKSATGSVGSLVKKKVLFDLEQSLENDGNSPDKAPEGNQSLKKLFPEYDFRDEKANDDDWNISNLSDDDLSLPKENSPSVDNIVLKTSQSDKIAEISKKIQDQLSIARQKPVGAIEAMFLAKPRSKGIEKDSSHYRSSTSIASSILESPKKVTDTNIRVPKPAPRTPRNHESDIESDIEELLQMG